MATIVSAKPLHPGAKHNFVVRVNGQIAGYVREDEQGFEAILKSGDSLGFYPSKVQATDKVAGL